MPEEPAVPPPPEDLAPGAPPALPPAMPPDPAREEEVGDFIARHVLEKDTVFFEG